MPVIIVRGDDGPPAAPEALTFPGLVPTLAEMLQFSGLVPVGGEELLFGGLVPTLGSPAETLLFSGLVPTWAVPIPESLPLPDAPGEGVVHGAPMLFDVQHGGFEALDAISYTVNYPGGTNTRPGADVTVAGQVSPGGSIYITASARSLTGGRSYAAAYGPFNLISAVQTQTPSGWKTTLKTTDTTDVDAGALMPELPELVPWEVKGTPQEEARKAYLDALKERALSKLKCKTKKEMTLDRRKMGVDAVVLAALDYLPIPYVILAPPPFPGEFFYAEKDWKEDYPRLNRVSYSTKGKKPLDVVGDIWGTVGWKVELRGGVAFIGPPNALVEAGGTAAALGVDPDTITGRSVELISPNTGLYDDPQSGRGKLNLPREIEIDGATYTRLEALLPPEEISPEQSFETAKDMTLSSTSDSYDEAGKHQSHTTKTRTKANYLLQNEHEITFGQVPSYGLGNLNQLIGDAFSGNVKQPSNWGLQSESRTDYEYRDPAFPKALTNSLKVTTQFVDLLVRVIETERVTTTQRWHEEGWMQRKNVVTAKLGEFQTFSSEDGKTTVTYAVMNVEQVDEEWTPLGVGLWQHRTRVYRTRYVPGYSDGEMDASHRVNLAETSEDNAEPERADAGDCPEDGPQNEEFTDDDQLKWRKYTGGRGDKQTVSIPWATKLPPYVFENLTAQTSRRRKLGVEVCVPVQPPLAQNITGSIRGDAHSCKASLTVEEVI